MMKVRPATTPHRRRRHYRRRHQPASSSPAADQRRRCREDTEMAGDNTPATTPSPATSDDSKPGCRPMTAPSRRRRWHREDTEAPSDEAGAARRGRHGAATDVAARTPWQAVATTAPVMTSGCRVMLKATRGAEKPRPTCKPRHAPSPCKCTCREASKIQCHASTCSTKEQAALQDSSALRMGIFPQNYFAYDLLPRLFVNSVQLADSASTTHLYYDYDAVRDRRGRTT